MFRVSFGVWNYDWLIVGSHCLVEGFLVDSVLVYFGKEVWRGVMFKGLSVCKLFLKSALAWKTCYIFLKKRVEIRLWLESIFYQSVCYQFQTYEFEGARVTFLSWLRACWSRIICENSEEVIFTNLNKVGNIDLELRTESKNTERAASLGFIHIVADVLNCSTSSCGIRPLYILTSLDLAT